MSDSLWPHGLQCTRPPRPLPSPKVCPSLYPLHQWSSHLILWHPLLYLTPSTSDTLFSICPQSFLASGTFPMSWLLTADDQNTGTLVSASVTPKSMQGWFPLRLTGLISLLSKGLSGVFSSATVWRYQFFGFLPSLLSSSHNHRWSLGRP